MDEEGSEFFIGGDDMRQQFRAPRGPPPWRGGRPPPGFDFDGPPPGVFGHRGFMGMGGMRFRGPPPRGGGGGGFMGGRGGGPPMMMMRGGFRPRGPPPPRFRQQQDTFENEDIWAETVSEEGKSYFYNVRTRVTSWSRPEGTNIRIVTHDEWVEMQASGRHHMQGFGGSFGTDDEGSGSGVDRNQQLHHGNDEFHEDVAIEKKKKPTPLMDYVFSPPNNTNNTNNSNNPKQKELTNMNMGFTQFPPPTAAGDTNTTSSSSSLTSTLTSEAGTTEQNNEGNNTSATTGGLTSTAATTGAGLPSFVPFVAGLPPPLGHPPPLTATPPGQSPFANFTMMPPPWAGGVGGIASLAPSGVPPPPLLQQIDSNIMAAALEWSEHTAPDGRIYYFHGKTQKSIWEKPQALIDLDQAKSSLMLAAMQAQVAQQLQSQSVPRNPTKDPIGDSATKKETTKRNEKGVVVKSSVALSAAEKCRPVSSTAVAGTPWAVVWTGDRRVFFYNPLNKQSVWERPSELHGRVDVDELMRSCPVEKKIKKAEATSTTSPVQIQELKDKEKEKENGTAEDGSPAKKKKKRNSTNSHSEKSDPDPLKLEADAEGGGADVSGIDVEVSKEPAAPSAIEVEAKAAKERANIPLELRTRQFHEMLHEKCVSAFSTWEKELHKIVYDSRYLLLTSKERKAAFDEYVIARAEEEKQERKQKQKEAKGKFFKFLQDVGVSARMSYNEFTQRFGRESGYRIIEKPRDRESYFADFQHELKNKEKRDAAAKREANRSAFEALLKEKITDPRAKWSEAKRKIDNDSRYSALDSEERESTFKFFCRCLKSDIKSAEEKKKRERKDSKRRERGEAPVEGSTNSVAVPEVVDLEPPSPSTAAATATDAAAFDGVNKVEKEKEGADVTATTEVTEVVEGDGGDGDAVEGDGNSRSEEEGALSDESGSDGARAREERDRSERERVSLLERERQVQKSLASHARDRDREREAFHREEAVTEYAALLTDIVRGGVEEISWRDARRTLKEDRRWEAVAAVLGRDELEAQFNSHQDTLAKKKKQKFRELLDESGIDLDTVWKDIRKKIKDDPRFLKFSSSERKCEREFETYLRDIHAKMKNDFRDLLKETKSLTHKSRAALSSSGATLREIHATLAKDRRWHRMDRFAHVRDKMLGDYLDELERKGPPPPPTSTRPDLPPPSSSSSSTKIIK